MHFLALIVAVASAIFWISRAFSGARDAADAVSDLKNLPRKNKFRKSAQKQGLALINNPVDAAIVLMVSLARLSDYARRHDGQISPQQSGAIISQLTDHMDMRADEADERLTQIRWTVSNVVMPETVLMPMTVLINGAIGRAEADELAAMLLIVASVHGRPNAEQSEFLRAFRERTGLGV